MVGHEDRIPLYPDVERRNPLGEWLGRLSGKRTVLVSMPRTRNVPVNDSSLTERSILVLTDIGYG